MSKTPDKSWTKADFDITYFSGTGAGGQHRNRHMNCVRIKHKESGIITTGQKHKEKQRNFEDAFNKMAEELVAWHYGDNVKVRSPVTEVVRAYNQPDNRIKDHASGEVFPYDENSMDELIKARKKSI